jgi:hypothetical protein
VELHLASDPPHSLGSNYFHFGNSCRWVQLARLKDVFEVLIDRRNLHPNNSANAFCVSQTVSSFTNTSTCTAPSGAV